MRSSALEDELEAVSAVDVRVTASTLTVDLEDGRTITVPTAWYPRLSHGTPREWKDYEISALGIHWRELDEDLSIRGLLLGRMSGESPESLKFWLDNRKRGRKVTLQDFVEFRRGEKAAKKKTRK